LIGGSAAPLWKKSRRLGVSAALLVDQTRLPDVQLRLIAVSIGQPRVSARLHTRQTRLRDDQLPLPDVQIAPEAEKIRHPRCSHAIVVEKVPLHRV
jgi:hypothetical protein